MRCKILKSFPGSQDGTTCERFEAGTEADLSDYLMAAADPSWFEVIKREPEVENKAVVTDGSQTGSMKRKNNK